MFGQNQINYSSDIADIKFVWWGCDGGVVDWGCVYKVIFVSNTPG